MRRHFLATVVALTPAGRSTASGSCAARSGRTSRRASSSRLLGRSRRPLRGRHCRGRSRRPAWLHVGRLECLERVGLRGLGARGEHQHSDRVPPADRIACASALQSFHKIGCSVISALSCPGKILPQFKSAEKLLNYHYCCLLLEGFHQNFLDERFKKLLLEELV